MYALTRNEKGFTLVELMVVVVIIGILVTIAMSIYSSHLSHSAAKSSVEANLKILDEAVGLYSYEEAKYPTEVEQLAPYIEGTVAQLSPGNYGLNTGTEENPVKPPRATVWGQLGNTYIVESEAESLPINWD